MKKYFRQLNSDEHDVEWMLENSARKDAHGNVIEPPPYSDYEKKQLVDFCLDNNIVSANWHDFKISASRFGILCYQKPITSCREFFFICIPKTLTHRTRQAIEIEWIFVEIYKEEDDYFYINVELPNSEAFGEIFHEFYKCDDLFGLKKFLEFYFQEIKNKYL